MGKMRVHELAKEFGLENREVIDCLQKAGLAVKTHSSSVYADEARAALKSIGTQPPEKPQPKRRGMMIVRKKKQALAEDVEETSTEETSVEAVDVGLAAEATSSSMEAAEPTESAGPTTDPTPVEAVSSMEAIVVEDPVVEVKKEQEADFSEVAESAVQNPDEFQQPQGEAPKVLDAVVDKVDEEKIPAEPEVKKPASGKPKVGGARVVRMIDRDKLLERVPSRRLGGNQSGGGRHNSGGRSQQGERSQPGGPNRLGSVTELRVVSDPFGRGREMVAVDKDKKGAPGRGGVKRRGRQPNKREMLAQRERTMHPSRLRRKKGAKKSSSSSQVSRPATQPKASKRVIKMRETIVLTELAHQLGVKVGDLIRKLMAMGSMVSQNQSVDIDTAQILANEYEYKVESIAFSEEAYIEAEEDGNESNEGMESRAPVVTIMGHVDHGKTSLLDAIRDSRVASGEAGGITQHIGAYSVSLEGKGDITFIDTPGHAAFTEMRARGAQVTDLVILVVAADDGVMPQTEEAIRHSQAAGVPIIVAVNKCDLEGANPDKVTQELAAFELLPEAWGGDTLYVNTSATKGTGLEELLEAILLQAEMLELKSNPNRAGSGIVIEAQLDKGRGPVATVLVQHGTLKVGDCVVMGEHAGKVRAMSNYKRAQVREAGPSDAVEIIGLEGVPSAGDKFNSVASAEVAREISEHRLELRKQKENTSGGGTKMSLEQLMTRMSGETKLELKLVVKADVQGSVEAVKGALLKLATDEVGISLIYGGVGGVKESDIMLAAASEGLVLGFNVRPDANARRVADREGVEIRNYSIIYEMVDDVKKAMEGLLAPETKEKVVGRAEVRDLFRVSKVGVVAGCRVVDGKAVRGAGVRVLRDNVEIYAGKIGSLFHLKDAVREVDTGSECGVSVAGFNDVKMQDVLEFFTTEEVSRSLDFSHATN